MTTLVYLRHRGQRPTYSYDEASRAAESSLFTSKERDSETGLDFFGARYFSSAQGRFTSADPALFPHDIIDPQSWNKYSYTRNNPLRYIDPDGADWQDALKGFVNAFTSDNTAGVGRISSGNGDFRGGQVIGDAAATVVGALETAVGSGGEVLGVGLDATGVGAIAGVPINVASGAAIVQGGTAAGFGITNLARQAFQNSSNDAPKSGARTEPNLPDKTVASGDGVTVEHYTRSGDHGPAHLHVEGEGPSTRIGQNGKPLKGDPELSSTQRGVVQENKGAIRKAVDQIQRYFKYNENK